MRVVFTNSSSGCHRRRLVRGVLDALKDVRSSKLRTGIRRHLVVRIPYARAADECTRNVRQNVCPNCEVYKDSIQRLKLTVENRLTEIAVLRKSEWKLQYDLESALKREDMHARSVHSLNERVQVLQASKRRWQLVAALLFLVPVLLAFIQVWS